MTIFCIKEQEIDGYVFKETSKNVNLELEVIRGSDTGELLILPSAEGLGIAKSLSWASYFNQQYFISENV